MNHYRVFAAQHSNLSNAWLPISLVLEDQGSVKTHLSQSGERALEFEKSHHEWCDPVAVALDFSLEFCSAFEGSFGLLSLGTVPWPWEIRVSVPQVVLLHLGILLNHLF